MRGGLSRGWRAAPVVLCLLLQGCLDEKKVDMGGAAKKSKFKRPLLNAAEEDLMHLAGDPSGSGQCTCLGFKDMTDAALRALTDMGLDVTTGSYCAAWDDETCAEQTEDGNLQFAWADFRAARKMGKPVEIPHRCGSVDQCAAPVGARGLEENAQQKYRHAGREAAGFCCQAWCWVDPNNCRGKTTTEVNGVKQSEDLSERSNIIPELYFSYYACSKYQKHTRAGDTDIEKTCTGIVSGLKPPSEETLVRVKAEIGASQHNELEPGTEFYKEQRLLKWKADCKDPQLVDKLVAARLKELATAAAKAGVDLPACAPVKLSKEDAAKLNVHEDYGSDCRAWDDETCTEPVTNASAAMQPRPDGVVTYACGDKKKEMTCDMAKGRYPELATKASQCCAPWRYVAPADKCLTPEEQAVTDTGPEFKDYALRRSYASCRKTGQDGIKVRYKPVGVDECPFKDSSALELNATRPITPVVLEVGPDGYAGDLAREALAREGRAHRRVQVGPLGLHPMLVED